MRARAWFALLLGIVSSCDPGAKAVVLSAGPIEGVEDALTGVQGFHEACVAPLTVPLASDSPVLAVVQTADLDSRRGVLVTDPIEKRVFQFDLSGKLLRTLGRPGSGPGEFRDLVDAVFVAGENVVALDGIEGVTLFEGKDARVRTRVGETLFGGSTVARLGTRKVIVGTGGVAPQPPSFALARILDLDTGRFLRSFGQESWERVRPVMLFRGVRVAADPSGSRIVLAVPYRLGVDLFGSDGDSLTSWDGRAAAFRVPKAQTEPFGSQNEANEWVLSSSYLIGVAMPDSTVVLLAWDAYRQQRRHYYLGAYSVPTRTLLSVQEIPYRFLRGYGDTLLFLNSVRAPSYELIACRGWRVPSPAGSADATALSSSQTTAPRRASN